MEGMLQGLKRPLSLFQHLEQEMLDHTETKTGQEYICLGTEDDYEVVWKKGGERMRERALPKKEISSKMWFSH